MDNHREGSSREAAASSERKSFRSDSASSCGLAPPAPTERAPPERAVRRAMCATRRASVFCLRAMHCAQCAFARLARVRAPLARVIGAPIRRLLIAVLCWNPDPRQWPTDLLMPRAVARVALSAVSGLRFASRRHAFQELPDLAKFVNLVATLRQACRGCEHRRCMLACVVGRCRICHADVARS